MTMRLLTAAVFSCLFAGIAIANSQPSADDERRAAITVMRAINTAEHAIKASTGKFAPLGTLLNHPAMGRVLPNIVVNGSTVTHQGAQIRVALAQDALAYQVTVVPALTCGTAVFSNEDGLIYAGKVLDC